MSRTQGKRLTSWDWMLKDDSLTDAADLPAPDVLAREIIGELESALEEFNAIVVSLEGLKG